MLLSTGTHATAWTSTIVVAVNAFAFFCKCLGALIFFTAQALDNLDSILSVEGLDAIYIGPSDLSLSLGCTPTFDDVDTKAAEAIDHILECAKAYGVKAGIHNGTPEAALKRVAKGFQFVR